MLVYTFRYHTGPQKAIHFPPTLLVTTQGGWFWWGGVPALHTNEHRKGKVGVRRQWVARCEWAERRLITAGRGGDCGRWAGVSDRREALDDSVWVAGLQGEAVIVAGSGGAGQKF